MPLAACYATPCYAICRHAGAKLRYHCYYACTPLPPIFIFFVIFAAMIRLLLSRCCCLLPDFSRRDDATPRCRWHEFFSAFFFRCRHIFIAAAFAIRHFHFHAADAALRHALLLCHCYADAFDAAAATPHYYYAATLRLDYIFHFAAFSPRQLRYAAMPMLYFRLRFRTLFFAFMIITLCYRFASLLSFSFMMPLADILTSSGRRLFFFFFRFFSLRCFVHDHDDITRYRLHYVAAFFRFTLLLLRVIFHAACLFF